MSNASKLSGPQRDTNIGIAFMVIAMLLMPGIDAIAKHLSTTVPAGQVTWARFAFQTIVLLPFLWRSISRLAAQDILPQCIRGITLALANPVCDPSTVINPVQRANFIDLRSHR